MLVIVSEGGRQIFAYVMATYELGIEQADHELEDLTEVPKRIETRFSNGYRSMTIRYPKSGFTASVTEQDVQQGVLSRDNRPGPRDG